MLKKFTSLLLAFVMIFALAGCKTQNDENTNDKKSKNETQKGDPVVTKALTLVDKGDLEGAYDLLWQINERNAEQEELFKKFAFAQTEVKKILDNNVVYTKTLSYNEDGYLLNRTVVNNQDGSTYTIIETSTYDENNNILSYNSNGTGRQPNYISHTYNDKGKLSSRTIGNIITETFTYHSNGRMASYVYKNTSGADYVPVSLMVTFDGEGNVISTERTEKDGSTSTGVNHSQLGATSEIKNFTSYLNNNGEEISISYDEDGNKIFEAYGYTVTCDKYNNAIKYKNLIGGTDAFGLTIQARPDEYYTYKLFYYPEGAPQVYNSINFLAGSPPHILPQYSNFYYNSFLD